MLCETPHPRPRGTGVLSAYPSGMPGETSYGRETCAVSYVVLRQTVLGLSKCRDQGGAVRMPCPQAIVSALTSTQGKDSHCGSFLSTRERQTKPNFASKRRRFASHVVAKRFLLSCVRTKCGHLYAFLSTAKRLYQSSEFTSPGAAKIDST